MSGNKINRVKALIRKVRGDGITAERLHNAETLVALAMLLDPKTWEPMDSRIREDLVRMQLLPLMVEIDHCIWEAIENLYEKDLSDDIVATFNDMRCKMVHLRQSDYLGLSALLATA